MSAQKPRRYNMHFRALTAGLFKGGAHLAPGRLFSSKALFVLAVLAAGFAPEGLKAQSVGCDQGRLHGTYAFSMTGTAVGFGPAALIGEVYFDGMGNGQVTDTQSVNGKILNATGTLTFILNSDCTGTETVTYTSGGIVHLSFVLTPDGSSLIFLRADPGLVLQGQATLMTRWFNLLSGSSAGS